MAGKTSKVLTVIILAYVMSPVILKYSPLIRRSLIFMNFVNFNLSPPEELGIKCTRQIRLRHDNNIEIGVWHILPESQLDKCVTQGENKRTLPGDKPAFADSRPIVLYVHGNGGTRAGNHRNCLYQKLAYDFDLHVVTFDYRGYGDSSKVTPTADGVLADTHFMYNWLLEQDNVDKKRVIVWGHSLGTAIAVRMISELPLDKQPSRLVLEAPLDSIRNAVGTHPFALPWKFIPYFEYFFVDPISQEPETNFNSLELIHKIKSSPILIVHAQDDIILPIHLGRNLYNRALKDLGKERVSFVEIDKKHMLGHKLICSHDETMTRVEGFILGG